MNNIYLVGMMGAGKTHVAGALAPKLKKTFVDLDVKIEKKMGFSIAEAFKNHGEDYFRAQESLVLEVISKKDEQVIATGGGVIKVASNIDIMKATGKIIYLEAEIDTLWARVSQNQDRPLLQGGGLEKLEEIYASRKVIYESICDFSVKTDGLKPEQAANLILENL